MIPTSFEPAFEVVELEGEARREEFEGDQGTLSRATTDDGSPEGAEHPESHVREVGVRLEPERPAEVERDVQGARNVALGELLHGPHVDVRASFGEEAGGFRWRHVFQGRVTMGNPGDRRKQFLPSGSLSREAARRSRVC